MDEAANKLKSLVIHRWKLPDWERLHPPERKGIDRGLAAVKTMRNDDNTTRDDE